MPEGRRYSPENPSPTAVSLSNYIKERGYDVPPEAIAAVWYFHKEWQPGHAEELRQARAATAEQREAEKAQKAQEREQKKQEREAAKAEREAEKERKRQEREDAKAEKERKAAEEGSDDDGEAKTSRKRLRTKEEPVAAGVSEASF